jgi:DNA polymerase III alpha subunit
VARFPSDLLPPVDPIADERLPDLPLLDRIAGEWAMLGFSPSGHLFELLRDNLTARGVRPVCEVPRSEPGTWFRVCGFVIRPHRPPMRKTGKRTTLFFDLEDETGVIPITCFSEVYQRDGHIALQQPMVMVEGKVDARVGQGLIAQRVRPLDHTKQLASPHARTLY